MQNLSIFPKNVNNLLKQRLKRKFDLKGSTVDRFTKNIQNTDKFNTFKDLDFLWMTYVDPNVKF